jgi:hypothetical protein
MLLQNSVHCQTNAAVVRMCIYVPLHLHIQSIFSQVQRSCALVHILYIMSSGKAQYEQEYVPASELGLPHPLSRRRVCSSILTKGGGQTRLRVRGWGRPNSNDWRKSLALCLLCGLTLPERSTFSSMTVPLATCR